LIGLGSGGIEGVGVGASRQKFFYIPGSHTDGVFAVVGEELGFDIDGYAIQHEMSTHYGRLVTTDDALMLFSDPVEAMDYLMK